MEKEKKFILLEKHIVLWKIHLLCNLVNFQRKQFFREKNKKNQKKLVKKAFLNSQ